MEIFQQPRSHNFSERIIDFFDRLSHQIQIKSRESKSHSHFLDLRVAFLWSMDSQSQPSPLHSNVYGAIRQFHPSISLPMCIDEFINDPNSPRQFRYIHQTPPTYYCNAPREEFYPAQPSKRKGSHTKYPNETWTPMERNTHRTRTLLFRISNVVLHRSQTV